MSKIIAPRKAQKKKQQTDLSSRTKTYGSDAAGLSPRKLLLRRALNTADKAKAVQPNAAAVLSVSGRTLVRPKVLLFRAGETYADRSQSPLKKTVVNTELPIDLFD